MSGLGGHLKGLHEDFDLTFNKILRIFGQASRGQLVGTEKTDGYNIFLSFRDGTPLAARNKTDIKNGGMTLDDLASREFRGGNEVKQVYMTAFDAYSTAITVINEKIKDKLFENGQIWYNSEIMGPSAKNTINYDQNIIIIHPRQHLRYNPGTGALERFTDDSLYKLLKAQMKKISEALINKNFNIQTTSYMKLRDLSDGKDLKIIKLKFAQALERVGLNESSTIGDYLFARILPMIQNKLPEASPKIQELVTNNIIGRVKLTGPEGLPKGTPQPFRKRISDIKKDSREVQRAALVPIEMAIHDFSVQLLSGLKSTYILDNEKEVSRLRSELASAIDAIKASGNKEAIDILLKHLTKINSHAGVDTAVEGFVFDFGETTYKITGNFTPINHILGLYKYGKGSVAPLKEFSDEILGLGPADDLVLGEGPGAVVAVFPGAFKPPHAGHYDAAQTLLKRSGASKIIIFISQKERAAHTSDYRMVITADMSKAIWDIFINGDPRYDVRISDKPSPTMSAFELMDQSKGKIGVLAMGVGEDDAGDTRFNRAQAWSDKNGLDISIKIVKLPRTASGTDMRKYIIDNDQRSFTDNLPKHLDGLQKERCWEIVNSEPLNESLTNIMGFMINESLDYQKAVKQGHSAGKKRVIGLGGGEPGSAYPEKPSMKRSKNAPAGFGGALEEETDMKETQKELEEISAMSAGSISGFPNPNDDRKDLSVIREEDDEESGAKLPSTNKTPGEQISREDFLNEVTLRKYVQKALKHVIKSRRIERYENYLLRENIRGLLLEISVDDKVPHENTGINVLEELLKKIIPVIITDYKVLTTDKIQRDSFRAHIINAIQNSIAPAAALESAGEIKLEEQEDINIDVGEPGGDEGKFIDIDGDGKLSPEEQEAEKLDSFSIKGEDSTGRNMALTTFEKIETNILDSYNLLDNEEDREMFYDYLLTNVKLYLDRSEEELGSSIEEPASPDYDKEELSAPPSDLENAPGKE